MANELFKKLSIFADNLRATDSITNVVNLGIGGSDLGPAMVTQGLAGFHDGPALHFVGNVDPAALYDALAQCDPHKTLFIVTSKSFTTAETLANASLAKDLRVLVRERILAGDSDAEVLNFVVNRYGEFALLKPSSSGSNLVLWLSGPFMLFLAIIISISFIRSNQRFSRNNHSSLSEVEKKELEKIINDQ